MNTVTAEPKQTEGFSVRQTAWEEVERWSALCQRFLDWQRREILLKTPSQQSLDQHRAELKWLLRFAKAVYLTASDPDYADSRIADEMEGRLMQLQESWAMVHDRMADGDADKLLREVFPDLVMKPALAYPPSNEH